MHITGISSSIERKHPLSRHLERAIEYVNEASLKAESAISIFAASKSVGDWFRTGTVGPLFYLDSSIQSVDRTLAAIAGFQRSSKHPSAGIPPVGHQYINQAIQDVLSGSKALRRARALVYGAKGRTMTGREDAELRSLVEQTATLGASHLSAGGWLVNVVAQQLKTDLPTPVPVPLPYPGFDII